MLIGVGRVIILDNLGFYIPTFLSTRSFLDFAQFIAALRRNFVVATVVFLNKQRCWLGNLNFTITCFVLLVLFGLDLLLLLLLLCAYFDLLLRRNL